MLKRLLPLAILALTGLSCGLLTLAPETRAGPTLSLEEVNAAVTQTLAALNAGTPQPEPSQPATALPQLPTAAPTQPPQPADPLLVAFALNGDLYTWRPGGEQARLTTHGQVADVSISPDAAWIAYQKTVDDLRSEIWAIQTNGQGDRPLVSLADLPSPGAGQTLIPGQLDWLPGTHTLLVGTNTTSEGPGTPQPYDLRSINLDSGVKKTLLPAGKGSAFTLSPDGKLLLLTRYDKFDVINTDGSGQRELFTYPFVYTYSEWVYWPDVVWSADSRNFRVIIPPQDSLKNTTEQSIAWEIPVDGSNARQLGAFLPVPAWRARPLLSPDGARVAYLAQPAVEKDNQGLIPHLLDLKTRSDAVINLDALRLENWSPDGRRLVVTAAGRVLLEMVNLSEQATRTWPVGVRPFQLTWVDAKRFLVLSGSREAPELYLGSVDGPFVRLASSDRPELAYDFVK